MQVLGKAQGLIFHLILGVIWPKLPTKSLPKEKVLIHCKLIRIANLGWQED